jgi:quinol monooxygenase YgiN
MSDFQDHLKHQYAYVARGEFKPGQFAVARELYDRAVATFTHGFHRAYLLQEPGTDRGIAVIFWEDPGDMEDNRTRAYDAIMAQMAPLFAYPPETNVYEVVEDIPSHPPDKSTV